MYGGLSSYGSYGGYGGYGGMSSYGSSYGGLSSYNSSYGLNGASNTTNSVQGNNEKGQNGEGNGQNKKPQVSNRKLFFQEWFKMMGGLRSIVQLGFAAIALANFWTKGKQIFSKFWQFSKQMAKSIGTQLHSKIPTKMFTDLASPQKRTSAIKSIIVIVVRALAVVILCLGVKLRKQIRQQNKRREEEMVVELQKMVNSEVELVNQSQIEMKKQREQANL